jgi:signal transduction histidine kinase
MGFGLLRLLRAGRGGAAGGAARLPAGDVAAILSEALEGALLPRGVAVERAATTHAAFSPVDPAALREALRALVVEAAAAMPAGGAIRVALGRRGDRAVVEIADSGAPRGGGEAGEAARLVERCGGRLTRAAVPGVGNRARVELPAAEPPPLGPAARRRRV